MGSTRILIHSLIIILSFRTCYCQSLWQLQSPYPTSSTLNSINFIDSNTGWSVGENGTIIKTTDCGMTWNHQQSPLSGYLTDVCFITSETGWITEYTGKILKTSNGGVNWFIQSSPTTSQLNSCFFISPDTGWCCGIETGPSFGGFILKTIDGGKTWSAANFDNPPYGLNDISFISNKYGWAVGSSADNWSSIRQGAFQLNSVHFISKDTGWAIGGEVMRTVNGGTNWTMLGTMFLPYPIIDAIYFTSSNRGFAVGDALILRTNDGGVSWDTTKVNNNDGDLTSIYFYDGNYGWVAGMDGLLYKTTNAGNNWNRILFPSTNDLRAVFFTSLDTGYMCERGKIHKSIDEVDITLSYIDQSLQITDLDEDGVGESTFLYKLSCKGDVSSDGVSTESWVLSTGYYVLCIKYQVLT